MNINNLVVFNEKGYQIPLQHTYTLLFEMIGNKYRMEREYGWKEDANGHLVLDENNNVINIVVDHPGQTFGFDPNTWEQDIDYKDSVRKLMDEIVITIVDGATTTTKSFKNLSSSEYIEKYFDIKIGMRKEMVRSASTSDDINWMVVFYLEALVIKEIYDEDGNLVFGPSNFIEYCFQDLTEEQSLALYPSTQFLSTLVMEPVSTELASVETLFILEKMNDGTFKRPKSDNQILRLEFASGSNTKIVKYAEDWIAEDCIDTSVDISDLDYSKVYWSNYKAFDLPGEYERYDNIEDQPLIVTLGFRADEEGAYQDFMTFYSMDHISDTRALTPHRIGYLVCQNEAIGEDERYRTLFTNFGIPDVKLYPNLFKDIDPLEEGSDWKYLNQKSKQLFLAYDQIFPYVGTYKALINAVKFLGFNDIYFKEWYQYWDGTFDDKVSYDSVDISTGQTLYSKLDRLNVSIEEFSEWKKLNQLSLMYKINKETTPYDDVDYYTKKFAQRDSDGNIKRDPITDEILYDYYDSFSKTPTKMRFEIPMTKDEYSYYNLEVLAKLYALKEWLEKYILNVNCQIIDVTGEGVYFARFKEPAYSVGYYTFESDKEERISPMIDLDGSQLELLGSSATLACTIKEVHSGLTFEDLAEKRIGDYINKIYETPQVPHQLVGKMNELKKEEWYDKGIITEKEIEDLCIVGKPMSLGAPFEEIQYEIVNDTSCGTLRNNVGYYDEEGEFVECPLLVIDNEIYIHDFLQQEVEFKTPPIIRIKAGRLKQAFGKWSKNTKYFIETYFDITSKHTKYSFSNSAGSYFRTYNDYVTLYPRYAREVIERDSNGNIIKSKYKRDENGNKICLSKFKYTANNKYRVPMLVIENYDTFDEFFYKEQMHLLSKELADKNNRIRSDINAQKELIKHRRDGSTVEAYEYEYEDCNLEKKFKTLVKKNYDDFITKKEEFIEKYDKANGYVENFNKFILLMNEGFIENKEEYREDGTEVVAKLNFEPIYNHDSTEQKIWIQYVYRTPRIALTYFDSSTYEEQYPAIYDNYLDKIAAIDEKIANVGTRIASEPGWIWIQKNVQETIDIYNRVIEEQELARDEFIEEQKRVGTSDKLITQYFGWHLDAIQETINRYSEMIESENSYMELNYNAIKDRILKEYNASKENAYSDLANDLIQLKISCFNTRKYIPIEVHHIGDYEIFAKGIDGYDAPYVNKGSYKATVYAKGPDVYLADYNETEDGEIVEDTIDSSAFDVEYKPVFWPNYRRVITDCDGSRKFEYLDFSYIYDTPKEGDFLKIINGTEFVDHIEVLEKPGAALGENPIKIKLSDENPQNQNIFYKGALVNFYFIDKNSNEIILGNEQVAGPYIVRDFEEIPETDQREEDDNWVILDPNNAYDSFASLSDTIVERINNNEIDCYANVATQIEIGVDNIVNDYDSKEARIYVKDDKNYNNLAFKKNQVVKIMFSEITYMSSTGGDDAKTEVIQEKYISGTSYRIKDTYFDPKLFCEVYVLDGLVNRDLLIPCIYKNGIYNHISDTTSKNIPYVPYRVKCIMTPAHSTYATYVIKASSDSTERLDKGFVDFNSDWFAEDYVDNTFSFNIYKFNTRDAYDDWVQSLDSTLYVHENPIYNEIGNNELVFSRDNNRTFEDQRYVSIWDVMINQGKSKSDERLLYQVANDSLPIVFNNAGEYHFKLTAIDIYGNRTHSDGQGFIKVVKDRNLSAIKLDNS